MQCHQFDILVAHILEFTLTPATLRMQCKHQLAALVSSSLKRCPIIVVPDAELAAILIAS
jgi:hypothetical protein